jgi:hypothetical protein
LAIIGNEGEDISGLIGGAPAKEEAPEEKQKNLQQLNLLLQQKFLQV